MKASPARALLFVIGIMLIGWGLAPRLSVPAAAAPLLLVTETSTAEPPTLTPSPTRTENPQPPITVTPSSTATATPIPSAPPDEEDDDPDPTATPTASATPVPTPQGIGPDPAISKSVSPGSAVVGDTVTYTIIAANIGDAPAAGVVVEDTLPAFLAVGEVQTTRGQVSVNGQTVRVEIGDLGPGETVEIRVTARVTAPASAPNNTNLAAISSSSPDANPDNNRASAPLDALAPAVLPVTAVDEGSLAPLLATALGLALVAGSLLVRRKAARRRP
ncbi:MAG: hypothetical protein OHK0015_30220 [Chloroflexi bacterium OHK40]